MKRKKLIFGQLNVENILVNATYHIHAIGIGL